MIGEYLWQTNESATVPEAKIFCKLTGPGATKIQIVYSTR